jgi:hypothetical protein
MTISNKTLGTAIADAMSDLEAITLGCPNCLQTGSAAVESCTGDPDFDRTCGPSIHVGTCACCDGDGEVTAKHVLGCDDCKSSDGLEAIGAKVRAEAERLQDEHDGFWGDLRATAAKAASEVKLELVR